MLAAFCILCGLILLGAWAYLMRTWFASMSWTYTLGTVRGSLVEPSKSGDALLNKPGFRPLIRYAYEVDGQTYVSARFSATKEPFFTEQGDAQAFADRFPIGAKVRVRVNPDNPRQTLLDRHLTAMDALPGYLAIACIGLGLLVL